MVRSWGCRLLQSLNLELNNNFQFAEFYEVFSPPSSLYVSMRAFSRVVFHIHLARKESKPVKGE